MAGSCRASRSSMQLQQDARAQIHTSSGDASPIVVQAACIHVGSMHSCFTTDDFGAEYILLPYPPSAPAPAPQAAPPQPSPPPPPQPVASPPTPSVASPPPPGPPPYPSSASTPNPTPSPTSSLTPGPTANPSPVPSATPSPATAPVAPSSPVSATGLFNLKGAVSGKPCQSVWQVINLDLDLSMWVSLLQVHKACMHWK